MNTVAPLRVLVSIVRDQNYLVAIKTLEWKEVLLSRKDLLTYLRVKCSLPCASISVIYNLWDSFGDLSKVPDY